MIAVGQAPCQVRTRDRDLPAFAEPAIAAGPGQLRQRFGDVRRRTPKDKLSLCIAIYGYRRYTGNTVKADGTEASHISADGIDADESFPLAIEQNATVQ